MATPVYATVDDFAQWIDADLPANARALLRTASFGVREFTATAWYDANTDGSPKDTAIAAVFRDATCAQAAFLLGVGYDPLSGLVSGVETEAGVGSARVTYADALNAVERVYSGAYGLCAEARRIIAQGGIITNVPWIVG